VHQHGCRDWEQLRCREGSGGHAVDDERRRICVMCGLEQFCRKLRAREVRREQELRLVLCRAVWSWRPVRRLCEAPVVESSCADTLLQAWSKDVNLTAVRDQALAEGEWRYVAAAVPGRHQHRPRRCSIAAAGKHFSRFNDPSYTRRLRAAESLTGPQRYRAYAALDAEIAGNAVPAVSYDYELSGDFFSARIGCVTSQPIYGIDLAALCLKKR
jgi:hypothetical protein